MKSLSVAFFFIAFTTTSIALMTKTSGELLEQKITYHCVMHVNEAACAQKLSTLTSAQKEALTKRIEIFQKQLTVKHPETPALRPR